MTPLNVLSCFDGIACARHSLDRAAIPVKNYFAAEIDKNAIKVAEYNYPDIISLGDINKVKVKDLPPIDLVIAGSPCTSLSCAAQQKESGLTKGESTLFWKFYELLQATNPKYFILENVASMKASDRDIISNNLGVKPILINSSLVSAQLRSRYYWTNIPNVAKPYDRGIPLSDIIDSGYTERDKAYCLTATYSRTCARDYLLWGNRQMIFTVPVNSVSTGGNNIYMINGEMLVCRARDPGYAKVNKITVEELRRYLRKLTPEECEKLQTLPVGYTGKVGLSYSQRTKLLGNCFTAEVIIHILQNLKGRI